MPSPSSRLSPAFLQAHTEAQVASICRTHHDDPARTAEFVAAIIAGEIEIRLAPSSWRERHALSLLGLAEMAGTREPPPAGSYAALSPQFLRGRLPGQLEVVHRDRARLQRVLAFQQAAQDGAVPLDGADALGPWHRKLMVRLGVNPRSPPPIC